MESCHATMKSENLDYIAGFVQADGCFGIQVTLNRENGKQPTERTPVFSITQDAESVQALQFIKECLCIGTLTAVSKRDSTRTLRVRGVKSCSKLFSIFDKHQLLGEKRLNYIIFKYLVN